MTNSLRLRTAQSDYASAFARKNGLNKDRSELLRQYYSALTNGRVSVERATLKTLRLIDKEIADLDRSTIFLLSKTPLRPEIRHLRELKKISSRDWKGYSNALYKAVESLRDEVLDLTELGFEVEVRTRFEVTIGGSRHGDVELWVNAHDWQYAAFCQMRSLNTRRSVLKAA